MSATPEPVASGSVYRVTGVDDRPPESLDDFTADATVTVILGDRSLDIAGTGSITPSGVRFHEKSTQGKELRVWLIAQDPNADRQPRAGAAAFCIANGEPTLEVLLQVAVHAGRGTDDRTDEALVLRRLVAPGHPGLRHVQPPRDFTLPQTVIVMQGRDPDQKSRRVPSPVMGP